jgi:hypothetical protein
MDHPTPDSNPLLQDCSAGIVKSEGDLAGVLKAYPLKCKTNLIANHAAVRIQQRHDFKDETVS